MTAHTSLSAAGPGSGAPVRTGAPGMAGLAGSFVGVPGGRLWAEQPGQGPAVLFAHAGIADRRMWDRQMAALAGRYHVIRRRQRPARCAVVARDIRGVVKLVAEAGTGRVRGAHAVADGAGEMITAASYAIRAHMTITDLAEAWAPYLTTSEALRLAAQAFTRDVSRLSCCAA